MHGPRAGRAVAEEHVLRGGGHEADRAGRSRGDVERGGGRRRGNSDVGRLRLAVAAVGVRCRQADGVGSRRGVGVAGVALGARAAVAESPGPTGRAAGRLVGEVDCQRGRAGEGRGGEGSRGSTGRDQFVDRDVH